MRRHLVLLAAVVRTCGSLSLPKELPLNRRAALALPLAALPTVLGGAGAARAEERQDLQYRSSAETGFAYQPGLQGKDYGKSSMSYSDFTKTRSGLLYKDGKAGTGKSPKKGDRVVVDWTGYTIGYFGRPFETKKLQELDANDPGYTRFEVGKGTMIAGLEEAVLGMAEGGVRQIVVPPELGYPESDPGHEAVGPKPSTFSGQRALDFVLQNQQLIDKTLLFNVKLVRVDER